VLGPDRLAPPALLVLPPGKLLELEPVFAPRGCPLAPLGDRAAGRTAEAKAAFDSMRAKAKSAGDFNRMCWAKAVNDVLLQSALEDCRQGQRMNPDYPGLNTSLGMVLLKLGKLAEARAAFDKAVAAKSDEDAYMGRAIVRSRMGNAAGARADAAEARRRRADVDDTFAGYGLRLEGGSTASSASH